MFHSAAMANPVTPTRHSWTELRSHFGSMMAGRLLGDLAPSSDNVSELSHKGQPRLAPLFASRECCHCGEPFDRHGYNDADEPHTC
jgi:hypothetical protein